MFDAKCENIEIDVSKHVSNLFELFIDDAFQMLENNHQQESQSQILVAQNSLVDNLVRIMSQLKSAYYDLLYMETHIYKKISVFDKGTLSAWNVAYSDLSYISFKIKQLKP